MLPDGTYTGVVDRFEEDAEGVELAVVLLEDDGGVEQIDIPRDELPAEADQDAILKVSIVDGAVSGVDYEPETTQSRAEEAQSRFDQLAQRPPDDSDTDSNSNSEYF